MDGYYKGSYDLSVPCDSECGYVREKEEKRCKLTDGQPVFRRRIRKKRSIKEETDCRIDDALIRQFFVKK